MKSLFHLVGFCLLLLGCIVPNVIADSKAAHAFQILTYWSNYLAEENTPGATFTWSPGCGADSGSRIVNGVKRCTFREFLLYNWGPQNSRGDKVRPTGFNKWPSSWPLDFDPTKGSLATVAAQLLTVETDQPKPKGTNVFFDILGNTDKTRLLPSTPGGHPEVLRDSGRALGALANSDLDPPDNIKQLLAFGQASGQALFQERALDFDSYRIPQWQSLAKSLGGKLTTKSVTTILGKSLQQVDVLATLADAANKNKIGVTELADWNKNFVSTKAGKSHAPLVTASRYAMTMMKCFKK